MHFAKSFQERNSFLVFLEIQCKIISIFMFNFLNKSDACQFTSGRRAKERKASLILYLANLYMWVIPTLVTFISVKTDSLSSSPYPSFLSLSPSLPPSPPSFLPLSLPFFLLFFHLLNIQGLFWVQGINW